MTINKFNFFGIKNNIYYAADDLNISDNGSYQFLGESTDIDYDKILSVCDSEWENANKTLEEDAKDYGKNFSNLDFLAGSYINMLEESMQEILEISSKIKDSVKTFAEKQKELDNGNGAWEGGGYVFGGGGTNNNNDNQNQNQNQNEIPIIPPIDEDPDAPPTGDENTGNDDDNQPDRPIDSPTLEDPNSNSGSTSNKDEVLGKLEITDMSDLVKTLKDMSDKNNKYLDELLLDDTYFDEIKKKLLQSPFLSDESKKYLEGVDAKTIAESLLSILSGDVPELFNMNPLNLGVAYSYLEGIAFTNSITVEELLTNPKNSQLLKGVLEDFSETYDYLTVALESPANEFQAQLLKIIDGDNIGSIDEGAINLIREYINYLSSESGISVEELLTNPIYADILKNGFEEFKNTTLFMKIMSYFSDEKSFEIINNIFSGKNARAFAISDESLSLFKIEVENVAKSNDTNLDKLLSDSKFADFVKDALNNSKNVKEVGYIYRNQESYVVQNVVKNLCAQVKIESENENKSD